MELNEGKLHFSLSLVFMAMCEITEIRKGKKSDLSLISMSIIRDSIMGKVTIGDIVRRNQVSYGTATECVINLEKKGYVSRVKKEEDGRAVCVMPMEKAHQWFDEMEDRMNIYVEEGLARLSPGEQEVLVDLLARFTGYGDESLRDKSLITAASVGNRAGDRE
jgi:DNA-binding MarR family transcriptional regulator